MKRIALQLLTIGALTLSASAFADGVCTAKFMGAQLKPTMQEAFSQANTSVTIYRQPFIVMAPASCNTKTCTVVLDYMNNDPKTFVVIHEKTLGSEEKVNAKVVTVFQQELYQLTYQVPETKGTALNIVDMRRLYG